MEWIMEYLISISENDDLDVLKYSMEVLRNKILATQNFKNVSDRLTILLGVDNIFVIKFGLESLIEQLNDEYIP
jgi:hypothetical protein